jgi:hypothetical protein
LAATQKLHHHYTTVEGIALCDKQSYHNQL